MSMRQSCIPGSAMEYGLNKKQTTGRNRQTLVIDDVHIHAQPLDQVAAHLKLLAARGEVQGTVATVRPCRFDRLPEAASALVERSHQPCKATGYSGGGGATQKKNKISIQAPIAAGIGDRGRAGRTLEEAEVAIARRLEEHVLHRRGEGCRWRREREGN